MMSKRKSVASAVKKVVRTPIFRMRVEEDKTKYSRKFRQLRLISMEKMQ